MSKKKTVSYFLREKREIMDEKCLEKKLFTRTSFTYKNTSYISNVSHMLCIESYTFFVILAPRLRPCSKRIMFYYSYTSIRRSGMILIGVSHLRGFGKGNKIENVSQIV